MPREWRELKTGGFKSVYSSVCLPPLSYWRSGFFFFFFFPICKLPLPGGGCTPCWTPGNVLQASENLSSDRWWQIKLAIEKRSFPGPLLGKWFQRGRGREDKLLKVAKKHLVLGSIYLANKHFLNAYVGGAAPSTRGKHRNHEDQILSFI